MKSKKAPSKEILEQMDKLHKMNRAKLFAFVLAVYREGFIDGLREGESEFDDALILEEDEAAEYFGAEAVEKILHGERL